MQQGAARQLLRDFVTFVTLLSSGNVAYQAGRVSSEVFADILEINMVADRPRFT